MSPKRTAAEKTTCPPAPVTPLATSVNLDGSLAYNCAACGRADVEVVDGVVAEHESAIPVR